MQQDNVQTSRKFKHLAKGLSVNALTVRLPCCS